jgi:benzoyl-CoA reductase/2-hydroxyglutaryl-CoA dehydratase subunit BcrC/BadD/HgdB
VSGGPDEELRPAAEDGPTTASIDSPRRNLLGALERARSEGRKVVGYFPGGYVPEELIYASGALPVCLAAGGDARVADEALSIVPGVICPFARAQLGEMLLKRHPLYAAVDLLVVPSTCQHVKKIGDIWEYYEGPRVFKLGVPHEHDKDFELEYYQDRLLALKGRLEAVTCNKITDDKLDAAIAIYNRLRSLLRQLSETRRRTPGRADGARQAISALDFVRLNHASFYADPVSMVGTLEALGADAANAADKVGPAGGDSTESAGALGVAADGARPRLLLMGPNLAVGDYDLLRVAADAGADVVIEDIFEGVRDYWQTVEASEDRLAALARSYLIHKKPGAFMRHSLRPRLEFVLRLIRDFDVTGVLWYQLLCCEFYDEEAHYFEGALREHGLPTLVVESDYHALDMGPLKTRMAAFVETIQGTLPDA